MTGKANKEKILNINSAPLRLCVLLVLLIAVFSLPLYAQENNNGNETQDVTEISEETSADESEEIDITGEDTEEERPSRLSASERRRIEMELRTSTLSELAYWSRILGLPESGTREELSRRIRNHFEMAEPRERASRNQKVITIETAQSTEYFTIDVINEDYARLRGDVFISLKDGNDIHRIQANDILFNRTRNILTASGNVVYEKIEADKTETFRGENITVDIDNWASIFLAGSSSIDDGGASYLFSGKVISRTDQDVTILRNAQITSAVDEQAYWSISASKLWLLPGSDFAILNAVLKVGVIPVLYIPFFFFPTDSLIFHPVIGRRPREGSFVQTTTYILGQPKADSSDKSSLSRILGNSNDMQLRRDGLFLRSTGKKVVNPNEISLKALIDYYVNLGTYIGIDLTVPKTGILNPLSLTMGLGFTRTIFHRDNRYTPYSPDFDGSFENNHSSFLSFPVPFRYRMRLNSSISGSLGTLLWDFPYYSDPFVDRDFLDRKESMDWVKMLQDGAGAEDDPLNETEISTYQWQVSGSLNRSFTALAPYVSRVSVSSISTNLAFKRINSGAIPSNSSDPGRIFFAPDKLTIYNISGGISGAPLSLGGTSTAARPANIQTEQPEDPLKGIGVPISPWPNDVSPDERIPPADALIPPVLRQTFALPAAGNTRFNLDYQITPSSSSELQFMNSKWTTYEEVAWNEIQSILTSFGGNANVNLRMDHSSGLFSNTVSLTGTGTWRDYSLINDEAFTNEDGEVQTEAIERLRRQQYSQTNYQSSYSYNGRIQPFNTNPIFRQTNLAYSFRGTLVRSKRYEEGVSPADGPELTPQWGSWVKEETKDGEFIPGLNSHQLAANLAANIMENNQTLSVTANLPPLDELITTSATFRAWITETSVSFRMERMTEALQKTFPDKEENEWIFRPIDIRETLRFQKIGSLAFSMTIDPEEDFEITTIRSTLTLWDLRVNYLANKVIKSEFIPVDVDHPYRGGSWRQDPDTEPALHPRELSFAYSKSFRNIQIVRNRVDLAFNINTSLNFNLQQYTNSNFQFSTGFTLKVAGFLDVSLSATSNNSVIWRYFKNVPGMEDLTFMYIDGPQNNVFTDLIDSFNFGDVSKRERSGFKMQRFNLKADHFLGDWTASFSVNMYPFQDTTKDIPRFVITSDISFLVQWTPISEIKTDVSYDGRNERWTVK